MQWKERVFNKVEESTFTNNLIKKLVNRVTIAEGNTVVGSSLHIKDNTIRISGSGNEITLQKNSFLRNCNVWIPGETNRIEVGEKTQIYGNSGQTFHVDGNNNRIIIGDNCNICTTSFFIWGNNNTIILGDNISSYGLELHIEQNNNHITIGNSSTFHGREGRPIHINVDESTSVTIGEDCMFSNDIQIRTTDSHSIFNLDGKRINTPKDVTIGNHCWISLGTVILKGTTISSGSVIGAGSLCCGNYLESNCIFAGNPAKIIKEAIAWDRSYVEHY